MPRRFTEARARCGLSIDALPEDEQDMLAARFGLRHGDELARRLREPAFVREHVAALPPLCWALLDALIEAGGTLAFFRWEQEACEQLAAPRAAVRRALRCVVESGFLVGHELPGGRLGMVAIIAEAAESLTPLLAGLSLPTNAPAAVVAEDLAARRRARDTIALSALAAHRRLRQSKAGVPDRTTLKRLTKGLGVDNELAEQLILSAIEHGWLAIRGVDQLVPQGALLSIAGHAVEPNSPCAKCAAVLREGAWTSLEALVRMLANPALPAIQPTRLELQLRTNPYFQVTSHAGATWVRKRTVDRRGGDGHVTPSFEILLGPEADLELVGSVGLCCELQRIDHVLTLKLTPDSVAAGLAAGLSPSEIRAALAAVGPHGLPDNVAVMLEDWLAAVQTVRVRRGTFIFTADDDSAVRLQRELGASVVDTPAPRVLELDASLDDATLSAALIKARVVETQTTGRAAFTPAASSPQPPATLQPDAELSARFARARELGDFGVSALIATREEVDETVAELERSLRAQRAPKDATAVMQRAAEWLKAELERLTAWADTRHSPSSQAIFEFDFAQPLSLLVWLVLRDELRSQTLRTAKSPEELLAAAGPLMSKVGNLRRGADEIVAKLQSRQVCHALSEAVEYLDDDVEDDGLEDDDELAAIMDVIDQRPNPAEPAAPAALATTTTTTTTTTWSEPPAFRRARALRKLVLADQPRAGSLSVQGPVAVQQLLAEIAATAGAAHVQLAAGRVLSLLVESLAQRGREQVVHGIELRSMEARVIKLVDLVAAQPAPVGST